jgi:putative drug exporter of the RND superfamily
VKINLSTESIARASARRPWLTILSWVGILLIAGFLAATLLSGALTTQMTSSNKPESAQADALIAARLGAKTGENEMVIVRSDTLTVDDPAYRTYVEGMYTNIIALGPSVVLGGADYYITNDPSLVSADRHTTLLALMMPDQGEKVVDQIYNVTDAAIPTGFEVFHTGDASFNKDTTALAESTMKTGESVGIIVALVVLAIVFGALAAAFMPIALGIVAIVGAIGLTALVGQFMDLTFTVTNMISMMGLAVGIDYSLFILTRFREERQKGLAKLDAIAATGATANKAVLFSGITVMLALAGLVIFPLSIFKTMGIGAILVVFCAIAASLTLLPALMCLLGDKVNSLRIPFIMKKNPAPEDANKGMWAWTTRIVTRKPWISVAVTVLVLAAAIVPYFSKNTGMSGLSGLPDYLTAKQGYMVLEKEFGYGSDYPATIVLDGDINSPATQAAVTALEAKINSDTAFAGSMMIPYADKNLAVVYARIAGDPMAKGAMDAVSRLRSDYIPATMSAAPVTALVTGQTAGILDFNLTTNTYTPIIFGFVLSLSFVVLTLAFRSIVIPLTAIVMNLLSVGASYGLLVLVFQKGIGARLLGFQRVDVIESWLPLFLFAILFGLSMDYQVFLLSRIRERYNHTGDNAESVAYGLRSTGKLITGAALIMVAVFGGFALGDMVMFQQMGFGLAVAVLLDATLVRSILVPATMEILGKANWYLPRWLNWIPKVGFGEGETVSAPAPREPAIKVPGGLVLQPVPVLVDEPIIRIVKKDGTEID